MAQSPNFLNSFNEAIAKLQQISTLAQNKRQTMSRERKAFSDTVIQQLRSINASVNAISGKIRELLAQIDSMKNKVQTNQSGIGQNQDEITRLTAVLRQLENDKRSLMAEIDTKTGAIAARQQEIDIRERRIRELEQRLNGPQQVRNQDDNSRELRKEIEERDLQIRKLEKQVFELAQELNNINATRGTREQDVTNNTQEIQRLRDENQSLIQRMTAATPVIMSAIDILNSINETNDGSNPAMQQLLADLERSIEGISRMLNLSPPGQGANPPVQGSSRGIFSGLFGNSNPQVRNPMNNSESVNNSNLFGGKKRTKKQKGGFIYNPNSKMSFSSKRSSTNSRTSSRSRTSKRKKLRRNTGSI